MCVTFWMQHPWAKGTQFPFVIAFNRDEIITREAEFLSFQTKRDMPNIVCGIDKPTNSTWFAFNKRTGHFACLTNFRTVRNSTLKREYESRGSLVLEYVKIGDEDIFEGDRQTIEGFMERLRCDSYRGFNLVYGNLYKPAEAQKLADTGILKYYQDQNWVERPDINERPVLGLPMNKAHGMSNGSVNDWPKVIRGRYEFFKLFCKKEKEAV